jgi:membrane-bound lytic murein transglycosylase D
LPAETTNYVPIILAMTIMEKNAAEYGLEGAPLDPPLEYDTIETAAPTSLSLVADIADMPAAELAALNPALLKGIAPAGYSLHVPKGTGNQLMAALQMVPAEHRDAWRLHRVGSGETVESIAQRYRTTPAVILAANNLKSAEAQAGDRLVIPSVLRAAAPAHTAATARRTTATRRAVGRTRTRTASASASRPAGRSKRSVKSAAAPRRTKSTVILAKVAR